MVAPTRCDGAALPAVTLSTVALASRYSQAQWPYVVDAEDFLTCANVDLQNVIVAGLSRLKLAAEDEQSRIEDAAAH